MNRIAPGQRYARLVVLNRAGRLADGRIRWQCTCDCGAVAHVSGRHLLSGGTRSCGCLRLESLQATRSARYGTTLTNRARHAGLTVPLNTSRRCQTETVYR